MLTPKAGNEIVWVVTPLAKVTGVAGDATPGVSEVSVTLKEPAKLALEGMVTVTNLGYTPGPYRTLAVNTP